MVARSSVRLFHPWGSVFSNWRKMEGPAVARLCGTSHEGSDDYVGKWTSLHQFVKWRVRLNHQGVFKLVIRMSAPGPAYKGSYAVCLGEQRIPGHIVPSETAAPLQDEHEVRLAAGEHDIMVMPVSIEGDELMRLHAITLIPLSTHQEQKETFEELDTTDVGN